MTDTNGRTSLNETAVVWSIPVEELATRMPGNPLLIMMHGYGSHEGDLMSLAALLPESIIVVSLRAPHRAPYPIESGFDWFSNGDPANPGINAANSAAEAVVQWLDRMLATHGTPSRIGLLGFSQGGAMAVHLLRYAPERFTAAVNLSGFVVAAQVQGDPVLAEQRPPIFWGRDQADQVIPAEAVQRTAEWLAVYSTATIELYPGTQHGISREEISDVSAFLSATLVNSNPL